MKPFRFILVLYIFSLLFSCQQRDVKEEAAVSPPLFERVPDSRSNISFINELTYNERLNTYTYRNFYNGAGVAIGDINNDGLVDIYFAGNQADNVLYLNKGGLVFEDITEGAGVSCPDVWSTGVSMADVNGDGLLDIYVCKSGPPEGTNRNNELFINNGDLTFSEQAAEWGIDDKGLSNHAVFFDYDRDGDLDMYLLNNSMRSIGIYDLRSGQREIRDPEEGNRLYRNDGGKFTDVSEAAGIYGSAIGFGLGVTVADINRDMWPDIFVSNDFFERDYLYMNNQDGTFTESLTAFTTETSMGSMGADIADLTNDGYPEIYVTEMLPATLERIKTKTIFENWDKYQSNIRNGYFHQFTRNVLQHNNGPSPDDSANVSFSEVARLTGTHATDWSWGALLFDADNNGFRDIFVANGIYKDLTDQDYINFYSNNEFLISRHREDSTVLTAMIDKIPSVPIKNAFYLNQGDMSFDEERAGLEFSGFSNGSAYGDLDNDGDLDLVVSNINAPALVYENLATGNTYIQLTLIGRSANTWAFGSFVEVYTDHGRYYSEQQPVKGYMSSMDPKIHLGLGKSTRIDSLIVDWSGGGRTTLRRAEINTHLVLTEPEQSEPLQSRSPKSGNRLMNQQFIPGLDTVVTRENIFNDFNRDQLLFEMYSNEGPTVTAADLNGDAREDLIIGGSSGQATRVFLQTSIGTFIQGDQQGFESDKRSEDVAVAVLDVDSDGDLDIYVASGGNEFSYGDAALKDRLYINDGKAGFVRNDEIFPRQLVPPESTGFVLVKDIDADGDPDVITGSRLKAFNYGRPADAFLFMNEGRLTNVTSERAPEFASLGLLTDAAFADIDGDNKEELIIAGEWMKPIAFKWTEGGFVRTALLDQLPAGLYKCLEVVDLNKDGNPDLVFGNHGTNSRLSASRKQPLTLHVNDFDQNGRLDHILSVYENGVAYPLNLYQDLSKQMPVVRKRYSTFAAYSTVSTTELLTGMDRNNETTLIAENLSSIVAINTGNGSWKVSALPWEAQVSPIYAIFAEDISGNGSKDLLVGGNQKRAKPELGIYNASYGLLLEGNDDGTFKALTPLKSGVLIKGEIRGISPLIVRGERILVIGRNDEEIVCYK